MHGSRALPVRPYFALAFGWTWALWWTAAAFPQLPGSLLFMTGGLGPLMGAAWIVQRGGDAYRRRFLHRVWDPRGITAPWWSAMLAVTAAPALLGAVAADLAGVAATLPDRSAAAVGGGSRSRRAWSRNPDGGGSSRMPGRHGCGRCGRRCPSVPSGRSGTCRCTSSMGRTNRGSASGPCGSGSPTSCSFS